MTTGVDLGGLESATFRRIDAHAEVHENSLYKVVIGQSTFSDDIHHKLYKVINKTNGLVEMESTVLYRALYSADDFEKGVQQHVLDQAEAEGGVN